jgi:amino acid transporter
LPDSKKDEFKEGIREGVDIAKERVGRRIDVPDIVMNSLLLRGIFILALFLLGAFTLTRFLWTGIVVILGAYVFVDWFIDGTFFSVEKECTVDQSGKAVETYHAYYRPYAKGKDRIEVDPKQSYLIFMVLIIISTIIGGFVLTGAQFLDSHIPLWLSSLVWTVLISAWLSDSHSRLYGKRTWPRGKSPPQTSQPQETESPSTKELESLPP